MKKICDFKADAGLFGGWEYLSILSLAAECAVYFDLCHQS